MIVPFALTHLLSTCAPRIGRVTMSAVVMYESGAHPFAIGDNTMRRAYFPALRPAAERLATALLRAGHNIDAGYAQVNSANFSRLGLDVHSAFEPCTNVAAGARVLEGAYAGAVSVYGGGQIALAHALSAYNSGGYWAGLGYARRVYATASGLRYFTATATAEGRAVPFHAARRRRSDGAR